MKKTAKWKDLYVVARDEYVVIDTLTYNANGTRERARRVFHHGPTRGNWTKIRRLGYRVVRVNLVEVRP